MVAFTVESSPQKVKENTRVGCAPWRAARARVTLSVRLREPAALSCNASELRIAFFGPFLCLSCVPLIRLYRVSQTSRLSVISKQFMPGMRRRALLPRRSVRRRALFPCLPASIPPCTLPCTLARTPPSCTSPSRADRASRERDAQPLLLALRQDDLVVERLVRVRARARARVGIRVGGRCRVRKIWSSSAWSSDVVRVRARVRVRVRAWARVRDRVRVRVGVWGIGVGLAWSSEVPSSSRCRGMLLIDSKRCCERLAGRVRAG